MMIMRNIKLWICVACLASSFAAPAPAQGPQLYLDIIDMAAISRMTPQQLETLAEGLAAEEIMRTKRSSAQALTSVVSKASSGLQSKVGLLGQASAFIGSASSKGGDEHPGYSYEPQEEQKYDYWGLKKSILYTLFQAVKAITGGVTILKGQLIKGGGALAATLGKVISVKGDAVSNLGKKIVSSAALSQKKPHCIPLLTCKPSKTPAKPMRGRGAKALNIQNTRPKINTGPNSINGYDYPSLTTSSPSADDIFITLPPQDLLGNRFGNPEISTTETATASVSTMSFLVDDNEEDSQMTEEPPVVLISGDSNTRLMSMLMMNDMTTTTMASTTDMSTTESPEPEIVLVSGDSKTRLENTEISGTTTIASTTTEETTSEPVTMPPELIVISGDSSSRVQVRRNVKKTTKPVQNQNDYANTFVNFICALTPPGLRADGLCSA